MSLLQKEDCAITNDKRMIAANNNFLHFHILRKEINRQYDDLLNEELNDFIKIISNFLTSSTKIESLPKTIFTAIFNFRLKSLKWLILKTEFTYSEIVADLSPKITSLKSNQVATILVENSLFAIRCNNKVINGICTLQNLNEEEFSTSLIQTPEITYQDFISSLEMLKPSIINTQKVMDWTNASLLVEFVFIVIDLMMDGKVKMSPSLIEPLSFLVKKGAEEHLTLSAELGLVATNSI